MVGLAVGFILVLPGARAEGPIKDDPHEIKIFVEFPGGTKVRLAF